MNLNSLRRELRLFGSPEKAKACARFFKTAKGQYGEGDIFIGATAAQMQGLARKSIMLSDKAVARLLASPIHEERYVALHIWVFQSSIADSKRRMEIARLYWKHRLGVNNWDLVDASAPQILGPAHGAKLLPLIKKWARSRKLWEKRIAMVATLYFIRHKNPTPALAIAKILLPEKHDLLQKATGWMLREVGKYCGQEALENFLKENYSRMGRTALRYAIERFPEKLRLMYLRGKL